MQYGKLDIMAHHYDTHITEGTMTMAQQGQQI